MLFVNFFITVFTLCIYGSFIDASNLEEHNKGILFILGSSCVISNAVTFFTYEEQKP